jgi:hypothetical protein
LEEKIFAICESLRTRMRACEATVASYGPDIVQAKLTADTSAEQLATVHDGYSETTKTITRALHHIGILENQGKGEAKSMYQLQENMKKCMLTSCKVAARVDDLKEMVDAMGICVEDVRTTQQNLLDKDGRDERATKRTKAKAGIVEIDSSQDEDDEAKHTPKRQAVGKGRAKSANAKGSGTGKPRGRPPKVKVIAKDDEESDESEKEQEEEATQAEAAGIGGEASA